MGILLANINYVYQNAPFFLHYLYVPQKGPGTHIVSNLSKMKLDKNYLFEWSWVVSQGYAGVYMHHIII